MQSAAGNTHSENLRGERAGAGPAGGRITAHRTALRSAGLGPGAPGLDALARAYTSKDEEHCNLPARVPKLTVGAAEPY